MGERILLPQVRKADDDELIIADGFSCQEQIGQQTDRIAMHTAQVLQLAIHNERETALAHPESRMVAERRSKQRMAMTRAIVVLGIGAFLTVMAARKVSNGRTSAGRWRLVR